MRKRSITSPAFLFILLLITVSCTHKIVNHSFRENYKDFNTFIHAEPETDYIKVHEKNGNVAVLTNWQMDASGEYVEGEGKLYDMNRSVVQDGEVRVSLNSIAIIETNQVDAIKSLDAARLATLSVLTAANVGVGIACIINPKACFGSCPTFYLPGNLNDHAVLAEGFSSSVAPSLENHDLDALKVRVKNSHFELIMKNEALETHVVNQLALFAIPVRENEFIFNDKYDNYYSTSKAVGLVSGSVANRNITSELLSPDNHEYYSKTDPEDLATKEDIFLEFNTTDIDRPGLILNFRQSLLTTYLFYNGLSWMGDEVGDYFAKMETDKQLATKLKFPFNALGPIKVYWWDARKQRWEFADKIHETGPIAINEIIVPLEGYKAWGETIRIKLELTKGTWRLDYTGLANIQQNVTPEKIVPHEVIMNGITNSENLDRVLNDDNDYLVAFPGDESEIRFKWEEEDNSGYQLFLYSKGYYLEWMREEWLKDKNPGKLRKLLRGNKSLMNDLARSYKLVEDDMENTFWNSKYSPAQ